MQRTVIWSLSVKSESFQKQVGNFGTDFTVHAKISDLGFIEDVSLSNAADFAATTHQAEDPRSVVQAHARVGLFLLPLVGPHCSGFQ